MPHFVCKQTVHNSAQLVSFVLVFGALCKFARAKQQYASLKLAQNLGRRS
jgi:hypothetical protein